uniref:Selectin P n=1 Tax=Bubo bubo TaxID=30461 RepID=A0A8C0FKA7_BUBBB
MRQSQTSFSLIGAVTWVEVGAWTYHYSDRGDYAWEQARNYCQTFFTDLVAIQNKQEIEYLNRSLPFHKRYYWIGIRKLQGIWTWVGTRKALTKEAENWAAREPNNRRSNQDCVEIYIKRPQESGKWNDEPCSQKKKALCYRGERGDRGTDPDWVGWGPQQVVQCAKLEPKGVSMNCSHPYGDFSYNSTCVFRCQEGFEQQGVDMLRCLPSQQWSADPPTCTGRACQGLGVSGMFTPKTSTGFCCSEADAAVGTARDEAACPALTHPALCLPAAVPYNRGELNCSHLHGDFAFGSTCAFSCQTGFALTGPETRECTAAGTWTGDSPRCEAISCPVLSAPDRGELNCSHFHGDFNFRSTCAFSCQTGFALTGPETRECTAAGTWTGDTPRCEGRAYPGSCLNCAHLPFSHRLPGAQRSRPRRAELLPPPWGLCLWLHMCLLLPDWVCADGAREPRVHGHRDMDWGHPPMQR